MRTVEQDENDENEDAEREDRRAQRAKRAAIVVTEREDIEHVLRIAQEMMRLSREPGEALRFELRDGDTVSGPIRHKSVGAKVDINGGGGFIETFGLWDVVRVTRERAQP